MAIQKGDEGVGSLLIDSNFDVDLPSYRYMLLITSADSWLML